MKQVMDLDKLLDEREIYRNLVHFARAMDERNWKTIEPTHKLKIPDTGPRKSQRIGQHRNQILAANDDNSNISRARADFHPKAEF